MGNSVPVPRPPIYLGWAALFYFQGCFPSLTDCRIKFREILGRLGCAARLEGYSRETTSPAAPRRGDMHVEMNPAL